MSIDIRKYLKIMNETGFFFQMRVANETREVFDVVTEEIALEHGGETSKLDVFAELSNDNFRGFFLSKRNDIPMILNHGCFLNHMY